MGTRRVDRERKEREYFERLEKAEKAEQEYRRFTKDLNVINRNEDPEKILQVATEHVKKGIELYPMVKKNLSGSSADAKHLNHVIHMSSDLAKRINTTVKPFDLKKIITQSKREHGEKFHEYVVNNVAGCCFNEAPSFEFFYGAIRREGFIPKERKRRAKIEMTQTATTTAQQKDTKLEIEIDSTPKEVEALAKRFKSLTRSTNNGQVNFFKAVIDPNSFTATVENLFHTSFLVKEGKVGVKKCGNSKRPQLTYDEAGIHNRHKRSKQSILSLSMADFNRWKARCD